MPQKIVLAMLLAAVTGNSRPEFQDFAVKHIYRGAPAAPKLSKKQRMFRTMIRRGAKSKVEFAGHYTVPMWGCGSGCSYFVIADSISGEVYEGFPVIDPPLRWFDEQKQNGDLPDRVEYHANSRLFKITGCPHERNCGNYDFEMIDGQGLKLVRKEVFPKEYQFD